MPPAHSRFEMKWSGEAAVRAGQGVGRSAGDSRKRANQANPANPANSANSGNSGNPGNSGNWRAWEFESKDMRAGGPRTQGARL